MQSKGISAYIIPSEDEHQSEYVAAADLKREWISGFSGSAGEAVVTLEKAALWTDSRYFLRAENELDSSCWQLMKSGLVGVPTIKDWLIKELTKTNFRKKIGMNSKLVSITKWFDYETSFASNNLSLESTDVDLIDVVWKDRPSRPYDPIFIHDVKFAGLSWDKKIDNVVKRLNEAKVDLYVVTALDEVAWLLNLRGNDIAYNPMFFAYFIVNKAGYHRLYINESRLDDNLKKYLQPISIRPYESVFSDIREYSKNNKIWVSPMSSYAILNSVTNQNSLYTSKPSPVRSLKAVKNNVEIENARRCQIRDSVARVRHMYWLEKSIEAGENITEISSATKLEEMQKEDSLFRGLSFNTISGVGAHASDIHFSPTIEKDWKLTKDKIYLLDAGAQYDDCTTDITRTHHYGTPSEREKIAYTKVLQGSIELASVIFPPGIKGRMLDVLARADLWKDGLDYGHGTGHGIGYFLSVHEAPPTTSFNTNDAFDEAFVPGMFQSDEPGYYEDNQFGIRLENDIEVIETDTPNHFRNRTFLTFSVQTLVPFDLNLIETKILTQKQIDWINNYYLRIRKDVGELLKQGRYVKEYEYLLEKTRPISNKNNVATCLEPTRVLKIFFNFIFFVVFYKFIF